MTRPLYAKGVTVITQDDDVFIEFRNESGKVFAVAGLTLEAASDFTEALTAACVDALNARHAAKAAERSGALH